MNSTFEPLQGATIFSKLDLCSGYHPVRIQDASGQVKMEREAEGSGRVVYAEHPETATADFEVCQLLPPVHLELQ